MPTQRSRKAYLYPMQHCIPNVCEKFLGRHQLYSVSSPITSFYFCYPLLRLERMYTVVRLILILASEHTTYCIDLLN